MKWLYRFRSALLKLFGVPMWPSLDACLIDAGRSDAGRKITAQTVLQLDFEPARDDAYCSELQRLQEACDDGRMLSASQLNYWADRYIDGRIPKHTGCTFDQYLRRPDYYERIAAASRALEAQRNATRRRAARSGGTRPLTPLSPTRK